VSSGYLRHSRHLDNEGTPTERVAEGDNALRLEVHRPCQVRFGADMLQTPTLLQVRIRMRETLAA
jgi:hypothetical protein